MLNEDEKRELKELANSSRLKEDLGRVLRNRHNPFVAKDGLDLDSVLTFLTEYNEFINHTPKPLRRIKDKIMKL